MNFLKTLFQLVFKYLNTAMGKMSLKRNHVGKTYKYMYDTNYVWYESNSHHSKERKWAFNLSESAYTYYMLKSLK